MKLAVKHVRVDQVTRFYRQGSILGGTIKSGGLGVEVAIDVESDEPEERIVELIRVAKASCYTHGSLTESVPVRTSLRRNGHPLEEHPAR